MTATRYSLTNTHLYTTQAMLHWLNHLVEYSLQLRQDKYCRLCMSFDIYLPIYQIAFCWRALASSVTNWVDGLTLFTRTASVMQAYQIDP